VKPITEEPYALQASPWRTLIAMTGSLSMIMLDTTVVGVALPTIQSDLHLSTSMAGWMVTSFILTLACVMAIGGRLGDRMGRLRIYRIAILAFIAAPCGAPWRQQAGPCSAGASCKAPQQRACNLPRLPS
jgi:MFS family permease